MSMARSTLPSCLPACTLLRVRQVKDSIIMPGARVEENAVVQYAIVAENAVIGKGSVRRRTAGRHGE